MNAMVVFYARPPFDHRGFDYPTVDWTYEDCMPLIRDLIGEVDGQSPYGYPPHTSGFRLHEA